MNTLYKPGDKVKLRRDLIVDKVYYMNDSVTKDSFVSGMKHMLGGIYTISEINSDVGYTIEENYWKITDEMIEGSYEIGDVIVYTTQAGDGSGGLNEIGNNRLTIAIEGFGTNPNYSGLIEGDFYGITPIGGRNLSFKGIIKKAEELPEYVELLKDNFGFRKGDIAKVIERYDKNKITVNVPSRTSSSSFKPNVSYPTDWVKPSTKEAFDKQNTLKYGDVGTYIVVINTSVRTGSFIKGGIYPIIKNSRNNDKYLGLPYIIDEANHEVNFIQDYIDNGSLKWFTTYEEAVNFSKELLTPKITVESEMERLGLHIGDTVKVSNLPIKEGWVNYQGSFDELMGVKGDIGKIYRGTIESNGKLYLDLAYGCGGKVLAEAVTKIPEFKLSGYKVEVSATTIMVGCTTLPKEEVISLLNSFMIITEELDSDKSQDCIFINGVKVNHEVAHALYNYITSFNI